MIKIGIFFIGLTVGIIFSNFFSNKKKSIVSSIFSVLIIILSLLIFFDVQGVNNLYQQKYFDLGYLLVAIVIFGIASYEYYRGYKNNVRNQKVYKLELENEEKALRYFDLLEDEMGYYNISTNSFYLNNKLCKLLNVDSSIMSAKEFKKFVCVDDYKRFNTKDINKIEFRVEIDKQMFSFIKEYDLKHTYAIIKRAKNKTFEDKLKTFQQLTIDLDKYCQNINYYVLGIINIVNSNELLYSLGIEGQKKEIIKYYEYIFTNVLNNVDKIYRLGVSQFAFIIKDKSSYEQLMRILNKPNCELSNYLVTSNNEKILLDVRMGIVCYNSEFNKDSILQRCYEMLEVATKNTLKNNFCIYHPRKEEIKYSPKNMGINLDEDLSKYLRDLDEK